MRVFGCPRAKTKFILIVTLSASKLSISDQSQHDAEARSRYVADQRSMQVVQFYDARGWPPRVPLAQIDGDGRTRALVQKRPDALGC
jgi:hypothetical protein